jgi:predicted permease
MINVFISLAIIAAIGATLRFIFPDMDIESFRRSINKLVLYIILPALIFNVIYNANPGKEFYYVPIAALGGIMAALIIAIIAFHFIRLPQNTKGALILASAFSNVTYLGLPVLTGVFSTISDNIAVVSVLYEVTTSPVLLSVGVLIAIYYGRKNRPEISGMMKRIVKLPPLWALGIVLLVKFFTIPVPVFLLQTSKTLSVTAVGLMIISLGMALRFNKVRHLKPILLSVVIQLAFIPFVVYYIGKFLHMDQPYFEATVIEAAMPTQLLTLVVADEFNLDTEILAQVIFITTVLSVGSIPLMRYLFFPGI